MTFNNCLPFFKILFIFSKVQYLKAIFILISEKIVFSRKEVRGGYMNLVKIETVCRTFNIIATKNKSNVIYNIMRFESISLRKCKMKIAQHLHLLSLLGRKKVPQAIRAREETGGIEFTVTSS